MKFCLPLVAAAMAAAAPASAVTYSDIDITFTSGTSFVSSGVKTAPGEYQDNFHFTTTTAMTFSGALSTQRLTDQTGAVMSDLDFGNTLIPDGVHIDTTYFLTATGGLDTLEVQNMPTTLLAPGDHVLTVNYTVQVADAINGAAYSGPLFLAAVPEPASWAMMIVGLGTVGAAMRRRSSGLTARTSFS